jgi:hypothetical protein
LIQASTCLNQQGPALKAWTLHEVLQNRPEACRGWIGKSHAPLGLERPKGEGSSPPCELVLCGTFLFARACVSVCHTIHLESTTQNTILPFDGHTIYFALVYGLFCPMIRGCYSVSRLTAGITLFQGGLPPLAVGEVAFDSKYRLLVL